MTNFFAEKRTLVAQIAAVLGAELEALRASARTAHEAATHAEARAENKYDTRGLEASYLAGAQAARAAELETQLRTLELLEIRALPPRVGPTALVEVRSEDETARYFILSFGAGLVLTLKGEGGEPLPVRVVTPQSPLGRALLGKGPGDTVTVTTQGGPREHEIMSVV